MKTALIVIGVGVAAFLGYQLMSGRKKTIGDHLGGAVDGLKGLYDAASVKSISKGLPDNSPYAVGVESATRGSPRLGPQSTVDLRMQPANRMNAAQRTLIGAAQNNPLDARRIR